MMTISIIISWTPSLNYNLLICCAMAPLSVGLQVKRLMFSNFQPKIFTFIGHVKTEKVIVKVWIMYSVQSWKHHYY